MAYPQQSASASPPADLAGTSVSRFRIAARLGSGGMGEVYRAEDPTLKRTVAIKRLARGLSSDPDYRRRFLREAERASALNHQHIAAIYDVVEQSGEIFLVMEYVEGQSLRQRMRGPLAVAEFLPLARQCAEALAAAHQRGIVHCDIKPENIMVMADGQVKILDFGVAKRLPRAGAETAAATTETVTPSGLSGTPTYMAPEVLLEGAPDARSDLFSLGVVFYEALAGTNPFRAATFVETANAILQRTPPPLRAANPAVPAAVEGVVGRLLAKDRAARYPGAAELAADLRALESGAEPRFAVTWPAAEPAPAAAPAAPARRRWRRPAAALLGTFLVALAVVLGVPRWREPLLDTLGLSPVPLEKHIAVLPITCIGEGINPEICVGLTHALTSRLTELGQFHGDLQVVPASEVFSSGVRSVEEARREFSINLALTGSLQRVGAEPGLIINLVNAHTLRQRDTLTIPTSPDKPAALQENLVVEVAEMLRLELEPQQQRQLAAGDTSVPQAFQTYLEGRGYMHDYDKLGNLEAAIARFQRALELDAKFALAHAGLGEAYRLQYEKTRAREWIERARGACTRARELAPRLAAAHICLGGVWNDTGEYERAIRAFLHAREYAPSSDDALRGLAQAQEELGRVADAESTYRSAIALRPSYWGGYLRLGTFYAGQARYDEAAEQFQRAVAVAPDGVHVHRNLCGIYILLGRYEEAIAACQKAVPGHADPGVHSNLGSAYFALGYYGEAGRAFEQAALLAPGDYRYQGNLGRAYLATGKKPQARAAFRRAVELAGERLAVNPADSGAVLLRGFYHAALGERAPATENIGQALQARPADSEYLFWAGLTYNQLGEPARAVDYLRQAVEQGYSRPQLERAPELESLRHRPEFQELISSR